MIRTCVMWNKQTLCNEVEKINQVRTKNGINVFILILLSTSVALYHKGSCI